MTSDRVPKGAHAKIGKKAMGFFLGLSGNLHDCAYCITDENGNILVHSELERDIRIKEVPGNSLLYYLQDESTLKYDNNIRSISTYLHLDHINMVNLLKKLQHRWDDIWLMRFTTY